MSDSRATKNTDSLTNAQGEFNPHKAPSEPLTTKGHQTGQLTGNDAIPEFSAKTLPAGTAPASNTFQPHPINETPGQANNPSVLRSHGKEGVETTAQSTIGGATSADVHTGLGHPGSGQTSTELRNEGKHTSKREGTGVGVNSAEGGSGMSGNGSMSKEFENLQRETPVGGHGPRSAREHNTDSVGAEGKEPVGAEEVAGMGDGERKGDYLRRGEKGGGLVDKK